MNRIHKLFKRLIWGNDLDIPDAQGLTVLMSASGKGEFSKVKEYIDSDVDVNIKDYDGWTALFYASMNDHLSIVRALLETSANIDVRDRYGSTALYYAAIAGNHMEIIKLLELAKTSRKQTRKSTKRVLVHLNIEERPHNESEIVKETIRIYGT